jgi:hypothetical protein
MIPNANRSAALATSGHASEDRSPSGGDDMRCPSSFADDFQD